MSIYEGIGMTWVIFTSALASIAIIYLAFVGLRSIMSRQPDTMDVPMEVKEMFKIVR
jgi:hypothetical protein